MWTAFMEVFGMHNEAKFEHKLILTETSNLYENWVKFYYGVKLRMPGLFL